ncbi:MAG: hypothetical protein CBC83_00600 [Flavobacteriales bacterium TMED123]|nr:MAG: hypothetical protein CBC83_00600 [Flavobacteriales bacterium TMED123]
MSKTLEINDKFKISFEPVGIVHTKYRPGDVLLDPNDFASLATESSEPLNHIAKYFANHEARLKYDNKFNDYLSLMYISKECSSLDYLKKFSTNTAPFTQSQMVQLLDDLQGFRQHCNHLLEGQLSRKIVTEDPNRVDQIKGTFETRMQEYLYVTSGLINLVLKCLKNFNLSEEFDDEYHGNTTPPLPQYSD